MYKVQAKFRNMFTDTLKRQIKTFDNIEQVKQYIKSIDEDEIGIVSFKMQTPDTPTFGFYTYVEVYDVIVPGKLGVIYYTDSRPSLWKKGTRSTLDISQHTLRRIKKQYNDVYKFLLAISQQPSEAVAIGMAKQTAIHKDGLSNIFTPDELANLFS